jgi:hypothetical protein
VGGIADAAAKAFQSFITFVGQQPKWVQLFFTFFVLAAVALVLYSTYGPKPNTKDFDNLFEKIATTISPSQPPATVANDINLLMERATQDKQKCSVSNLYFDTARYMTPPPSPPPGSLVDFISTATAHRVACIDKLNAKATSQAEHAAVAALHITVKHGTTATTASQATIARVETQSGTGAASQIMQSATSIGSQGWVYLGQKDVNGIGLTEHRTIVQSSLPHAGDTIVTTKAVNLRNTTDPKRALGGIVGVVPSNATLMVTGDVSGIDQIVNGTKVGYFVYAPVRLTNKSASATPAQPPASISPSPSATNTPLNNTPSAAPASTSPSAPPPSQ